MKRALLIICVIAIGSLTTAAQPSAGAGKASMGQPANIERLIDHYFDSLNETDDKRRRDLTRMVWAEKGNVGTPYGEVQGHEAIDALVKGVHKQFPNAVVRRTSRIDGFGDYLRWSFTLSDADGRPILSGVDFAIIADRKLQLVRGFFDFAPPAK
jgi:hypothetical protein